MSKRIHIQTDARRLGWVVSHCRRNLNLGSAALSLAAAENDGRPICAVCKRRFLALPEAPSSVEQKGGGE
jgi:hypothetical protein